MEIFISTIPEWIRVVQFIYFNHNDFILNNWNNIDLKKTRFSIKLNISYTSNEQITKNMGRI